MKVARETDQQLILADTPWFLGIGLSLFILVFCGVGLLALSEGVWAGLIFVIVGGGLGLAAFAVFVRRVQVILDRRTGEILLRSRSIFGYSQTALPLADLARAELEATMSSKGATLYRPVLVLDRPGGPARHPVVEAYSNGPGPQRLVDAVNGWLGPAKVDSAHETP